MKARPLHDRILVKRIEEGEQKVGGIIIPDTAKEKPQQGKVVAVGSGKVKDDGTRIPLDVKEGDTILFGKYSGPGDQARRRGIPDHARRRSAGGPRVAPRRESTDPDAARNDTHDGKADHLRRAVAAGNPARRERARRRGQGHPRAQGPQRRPRQEVRFADHHQGRRDGRQGNRTEGPAREHGRPDGAAKSRSKTSRRRR